MTICYPPTPRPTVEEQRDSPGPTVEEQRDSPGTSLCAPEGGMYVTERWEESGVKGGTLGDIRLGCLVFSRSALVPSSVLSP